MAHVPFNGHQPAVDDDPEAIALEERWNEAIQICESDLGIHEMKVIRDFQGPHQLVADLRKRLEDSAQGKLRIILSQISPFFDVLEQMLLLFTAAMPTRSIPLTLVSGGAYLTVKHCAEFEAASKGIVSILDQIKQQLILFGEYAAALRQEHCRQGLVEMFIAMIKFWVASFVGQEGNWLVDESWHVLNQKFTIALQEIEEAVKFVRKLGDAERSSHRGEKVAKAQQEIVEQLPDNAPSEAAFPCNEGVPPLDPNFLGRLKHLQTITSVLHPKDRSTRSVVVISGLGGVGKSSLAAAVSHLLLDNKSVDAIFWVHAESKDVLRSSFTKIALRLLLPEASDSSDKDGNFMRVKNWLQKTRKSWLLIYDNVEDYGLLEEYFPPDTGSVIITTRFPQVSYAIGGTPFRISLEKLSPEDSLELFNRVRLSRHSQADTIHEEAQTKELLELIDGLALGIKQMASYVASKKMKITRFQDLYNRMAKYILEHKTTPTTHTLGTLWSLQFKDLKDTNAFKLLAMLSLCGPDGVPRDLFDIEELDHDGHSSWLEFCEDVAEVEMAVDTLSDNALIDVKEGGEDLAMHRLTQEAFIYNEFGLLNPDELQAAFNSLVTLILRRFPTYGRDRSLLNDWPVCAKHIPHVSALGRTFKSFLKAKGQSRPIKSSEAFAQLLTSATWYLFEIGELMECLDLLEIATEACEDKNSLTYAYLCNTYAVVAGDQNDMSRGQEYSEKAIRIREALLEADDLDLAISYNNYANVLLNEGRFEDALKNYAMSDSIWVGRGSVDDTYVALMYLNIARVHSHKGNGAAAIPYLEKAEKTFSKASNKLFYIGTYNTWASLLLSQGKYLDALGMFKKAHDLAMGTPIKLTILMCAILYKLAVLDLKLGLPVDDAKKKFRSAITLAEYHQRDAMVARIGRHLASCISEDPLATDEERTEASELAANAALIKDRLWEDIGRHVSKEGLSQDEEYDWCVAAFYR